MSGSPSGRGPGASAGARVVVNRLAGPVPAGVLADPSRAPLQFHQRLGGYQPTPLLSTPALAKRLGVGEVVVKCESQRFGLPAFKMLGASWATYRALVDHLGAEPGPWHTVAELSELLAPMRPFTLATATDGNHGRAVARMARLLGFGARIFVPENTTPGRIAAIESEGASVAVVPGDYDAAVARAAEEAGPSCLVISDTSWPGYDRVPRWVVDGYSTMFWEIDDSLAAAGWRRPDALAVPIGVGALVAATINHYCREAHDRPVVVGVEPSTAACVTASAEAGRLVTVPGPHTSVMAGLNCGTPSPVVWPIVSAGVDAFVTIDDDWTCRAVRELAALGVEAGETGAAGLAGLQALRHVGVPPELDGAIGPDATVLVIMTEGASDPLQWRRILGVELLGQDPPLRGERTVVAARR